MRVTIQGDSGRLWTVDETEPAVLPRRGTCFLGWEEGAPDRLVWVQRVLSGDLFATDRAHLLRAYKVGRIPPLAACPYIRSVIDKAEASILYLIQEYAEMSLPDRMREGDLSAAEVESIIDNVAAALKAIHAQCLVHGDVQPSNVLCVDGKWKLADLGSVVGVGEHPLTFPRDRRFLDPDVPANGRVRPEADWYAFDVLKDEIEAL